MDNVKLSKFLSLVLRHKPEQIGLKLDGHGWADVNDLLKRLNLLNDIFGDEKVVMDDLIFVVENNNKKRFTFNEDETKIRANQGHSIEVNLELEEMVPPYTLYHGTSTRFINSIKKTGIVKKSRQYVHLSADTDTAMSVGSRHGKPVVITINARMMFDEGHTFYRSKNGVWLTDNVEPRYFSNIGVKND